MLRLHSILPILYLVALACSSTRQLGDGELLYKGARIRIHAEKSIDPLPGKRQLESVTAPRPNRKFLFIFPVKLWMYNLAGDDVPQKAFRQWLKYKAGEPPVLFRPYHMETSLSELDNALQNRGFFDNDIVAEKEIQGNKVTLVYSIGLKKPYYINALRYPDIADSLTTYISGYREQSLIEENQRYMLKTLEEERERISLKLNTDGFFYFTPSYLFFESDTSRQDKQMKLSLGIKKGLPERARKLYSVGKVYMHHDYSFIDSTPPQDTLVSHGIYHLYDGDIGVRTDVLDQMVFLKKGEIYNQENYYATINKLTGTGIFKFVDIGLRPDTAGEEPRLDIHINLTSYMPESVQAKFQAVSKSNDFIGPGFSLNYRNRNIFRGGEFFLLSVRSAFETQFSKKYRGVNSFEVGAQTELDIPRFVLPFMDGSRLVSKRFKPETRIKAGYNYFNRTTLFTAYTFNLSYGYRWKETLTKTHELDLLSAEYFNVNHIYFSVGENDPLRRKLKEEFIFSLKYRYTFSNLLINNKKINTYFNASAEFAGNTLGLLNSTFGSKKEDETPPSRALGLVYTQYARFSSDLRLYYKISTQNKLVGRLYAGAGIPYGNSVVLPYQKQFFIGGTNSIRAFPSRTLGPGSFLHSDSLDTKQYLEYYGDIKIMTNIEYRFNIVKIVKGALFFDAGNIWLINEDDQIPGGALNYSGMLKEFAVGSGVGIRFDASFLVLRLDLAFPIRKPYLPDNERWVLHAIDWGSREWRKENLVFNLAIGYPF